MCGIAGVVRFSGLTSADHAAVSRLPALLRHRGPDGEGTYTDTRCALVQTRLAVIGARPHPLPMPSPCGRYVLVYNGAVYNFRDLRNSAITDTEAVLHALIGRGPAALSQFNGMFSLFFWDNQEQRGLAACDRLAIKPFLYSFDRRRFWFASEAGALVESGAVGFRPNADAIAEHLTAPYFSSVERIPFDGLQRLRAGHYLEIDGACSSPHEYFSFRFTPAAEAPPLANALDCAVQRALVADQPPGVFLSGGVDSTLVAAAAQRHSSAPVRAWTIEYENQDRAEYTQSLIVKSDDVPWAKRAASRIGLDHRIVHCAAGDYGEALARTLQTNDLISAWEQEVSQNLLAQAAGREAKAVLVGDAADETHFGYSFLLDPARIGPPRKMIEYFGAIQLRPGLPDFGESYERLAESMGHSWSGLECQRLAMSALVVRFWLPRLLHNGDIHLMAHGVEGRVPFGDTDLLDLARLTPPSAAYRNGIEKAHLRAAAEGFTGSEFAWRPKSALTKNLAAGAVIQGMFVAAWNRSSDWIQPYADCDAAAAMAATPPASDRDTGLRFRILALLTWFERFGR